MKKPESHEGVQEAVPKCLPTDKQTNLLSVQDSQVTRTQGSGKQVRLDDHSTKQVDEDTIEQKDGNGGATQTILLTKLPPVLTIHLEIFASDLSKLVGHVSFKEILHVGPFMNPSCEDKDNSSYRLVGVIEHLGPNLGGGHYIAYVRADQQRSGSSSWVCADDSTSEKSLYKKFLGARPKFFSMRGWRGTSEAYVYFCPPTNQKCNDKVSNRVRIARMAKCTY
ncbi:hypothetical protein BRADI_3g41003v3 [Brachypodium distachyon]|uniref:USP domain-containing protein n=1 Tax=Brachypodium distachyon TaxID=15368 RepID=A0A2K2D2H2_BRADI|nr:hypothetical protein BRADI_3g41003v3 [Brachypodium distachyon]